MLATEDWIETLVKVSVKVISPGRDLVNHYFWVSLKSKENHFQHHKLHVMCINTNVFTKHIFLPISIYNLYTSLQYARELDR